MAALMILGLGLGFLAVPALGQSLLETETYNVPETEPAATGQAVEVRSGTSFGHSWNLTAYPSDNGFCLDLKLVGEQLVSSSCGQGVVPDHSISPEIYYLYDKNLTFVYGTVMPNVGDVHVNFIDGYVISAAPFAVPDLEDTIESVEFFIEARKGTSSQPLEFVSRNEAGNIVDILPIPGVE